LKFKLRVGRLAVQQSDCVNGDGIAQNLSRVPDPTIGNAAMD